MHPCLPGSTPSFPFITKQLSVDTWYDYLRNPTQADAILDRIVHNAYTVTLKGESTRKLNSPVDVDCPIVHNHPKISVAPVGGQIPPDLLVILNRNDGAISSECATHKSP
jgi:hypothetical protein